MEIYTVFDKKVGHYHNPMVTRNEAEMLRLLSDAVNDKVHPFGKHPGDYQLYYVGYWDDERGLIKPSESSEFVVELASLVEAGNLPLFEERSEAAE